MSKKLSFRKLTKEFLPISMSDCVMALGDPLVALVLATLPGGTMNLAAFGVAKGIAVFFESPIIMVLHASNALSKNRRSHEVLRNFSVLLGVLLSLGLLLAGLSFNYLSSLGLGAGLSDQGREAVGYLTLIMVPWPLLIALRRHVQGKLIALGKSSLVAKGSFLRLLATASLLLGSCVFTDKGYLVAGLSMIGGLIVEWSFITLKGRNCTLASDDQGEEGLSYPQNLLQMTSYYFPLAWTMVSLWGCRLGLTLILASSDEMTVAIWASGWALVVSMANGVRMLQQIVIRHDNPADRQIVGRFIWAVGVAFTLIFLFIGLHPFGYQIIYRYAGYEVLLSKSVQNMVLWFFLLPMLMAWQNALQGSLMTQGKTKILGNISIVCNTGLLFLMLLILDLNMVSVMWATIMIITASCIEVLALVWAVAKKVPHGVLPLSRCLDLNEQEMGV